MNKVVVKIMGSEYNIVGKNPEQMKSVARYVDGEMNKVKEGNPKLNSLTTTIVACLNIADELFDCCHENEALHNELEALKDRLNEPSGEVQVEVQQISSKLEQKDLEIIEQNEKIEDLNQSNEKMKLELEKYKAEIEGYKKAAEEAIKEAENATKMSSEWQNKNYSLQLRCSELESKFQDREGAL